MAGLRVAINAQLLHTGSNYRNAGISRYIRSLLLWLPKVDPEISLLAFVGPAADISSLADLDPRIRLLPTRLPTHRPFLRILWEQLILPEALTRCRPTAFHSPLNALPLLCRTSSAVTVHDLAFELFPGTYPALKALYLRLSTRHGARHAKRVIAVSRATANDLIDLYTVAPERISIIPNGVDERFKPQRHEDCEGFRSARGFGPYFLYLGTLQPRKNLTTLLKAWELTAARHAGYRLVIAGPPGWHNSELMKLSQRLNLSDSVTFLGWLPDEEIPLLLGAATALLFPSLYEGFGLPVLEAMACRTPVVVSDAPALKEVAEGAGLVVAARDTSAWAQAIDLMVQQPELRQTLAEAGLEKAGLYSWRRTAELTAKVYRQVAHQ